MGVDFRAAPGTGGAVGERISSGHELVVIEGEPDPILEQISRPRR
jgi:hypothetical protein